MGTADLKCVLDRLARCTQLHWYNLCQPGPEGETRHSEQLRGRLKPTGRGRSRGPWHILFGLKDKPLMSNVCVFATTTDLSNTNHLLGLKNVGISFSVMNDFSSYFFIFQNTGYHSYDNPLESTLQKALTAQNINDSVQDLSGQLPVQQFQHRPPQRGWSLKEITAFKWKNTAEADRRRRMDRNWPSSKRSMLFSLHGLFLED